MATHYDQHLVIFLFFSPPVNQFGLVIRFFGFSRKEKYIVLIKKDKTQWLCLQTLDEDKDLK